MTMFLNTIKAYDGLTNEITEILTELGGRRIIMDANHNLLNHSSIIGKIYFEGNVIAKIELYGEYQDYSADISFFIHAKELKFSANKESVILPVPPAILQEYLVLTEEEYVTLATKGDLIATLQANNTHGVVIRQKDLIRVQYDYCYAKAAAANEVFVSNGLVQLTMVNAKPATRYVNKFTMNGEDAYLCVFDLSYVSNVGTLFAPVSAKSLHKTLFGVHQTEYESDSNKLQSMSTF